MNTLRKCLVYLGVSAVSSFVFAVTWVILMTLTLPETDYAHGQMPFEDSFVFPIMSMFAGLSALIAWPFYAFFGWNLPPKRVALTAGAATLLFILIATPFSAVVGWLGSYLVLLLSLTICKFGVNEVANKHIEHTEVPRHDGCEKE